MKYGSCSLAGKKIKNNRVGFFFGGGLGGKLKGNDNYFKGTGNKMHLRDFVLKQVSVNKIYFNSRS